MYFVGLSEGDLYVLPPFCYLNVARHSILRIKMNLNAVFNALKSSIGQRDQLLVFYLLANCKGCNNRENRIF